MLNPYEPSPDEDIATPEAVGLIPNPITKSRDSIAVISILYGFLAAISIVVFLFYLLNYFLGFFNLEEAVDPYWMIGIILHGAGYGCMAHLLWQYQGAIKHWIPADQESSRRFADAHSKVWATGAFFLVTFLCWACLYLLLPLLTSEY